jgi:pyruvate-formate lyase-activating enzyme
LLLSVEARGMKVFLGWAKPVSKKVAQALNGWLPLVLQDVECFFSEEDIRKGEEWRPKLINELDSADFGIICVSRENADAPWIHFELGKLQRKGVATLLVDNLAADASPAWLNSLTHTRFERNDLINLVHTINEKNPNHRVDRERLTMSFDTWWPRLERTVRGPTYPIGGVVSFRGSLRDIPPTKLDGFHAAARERFDVVGHSLSGHWTRGGQIAIVRALANGATVRVIFLDPTQVHSDQIAQISEKLGRDLKQKIWDSIRAAARLKADLRTEMRNLGLDQSNATVDKARARFQIAASCRISYMNIQRVDDVMLVSQYSHSYEPGLDAPATELTLQDDRSLFLFYEKEFERIWGDASPIEELLGPHGIQNDRSRILEELPVIQQVYSSVHDDRERLPYPRKLIVLPCMACALACPNCFTRQSGMMNGQSMRIELVRSILEQAKEMGVSCVELAGGGEPLDHPHAEQLLAIVAAGRKVGIKSGLLTNGLAVTPQLAAEIVNFDYVRIGFTEFLDDPRSVGRSVDFEKRFWDALEIVVDEKIRRQANVRIGAKVLLTSKNADFVEQRIVRLLDLKRDGTPAVDHIKIKSLRGDGEPSTETVRLVEHKLALLKHTVGQRADDLQIDIKSARVPSGYRCWISPIMSVVNATGEVYLCCNFYERPEESLIGSLGTKGEGRFAHFWGLARHRSVIERLQPDKVCNSHLGCNCRLVSYQSLVEPYVAYLNGLSASRNQRIGGSELM